MIVFAMTALMAWVVPAVVIYVLERDNAKFKWDDFAVIYTIHFIGTMNMVLYHYIGAF